MTLSQSTKELLSQINTLSGNTLKRSMDLGVILELARQQSQQTMLDDLAFSSKFLIKSIELLKRIGEGGEGYDKIEQEVAAQTEKARTIIARLSDGADAMTQSHMRGTYLSMDTVSLQNLLQLFHDLRWYKNYQMDHR
jgi:hypothetical protein